MRRVLALGDGLVVLFYLGVGISISHALLGFPRLLIEPDHIGLGIAAFIVVGTGWVIGRSLLRQRNAAASDDGNDNNSSR